MGFSSSKLERNFKRQEHLSLAQEVAGLNTIFYKNIDIEFREFSENIQGKSIWVLENLNSISRRLGNGSQEVCRCGTRALLKDHYV